MGRFPHLAAALTLIAKLLLSDYFSEIEICIGKHELSLLLPPLLNDDLIQNINDNLRIKHLCTLQLWQFKNIFDNKQSKIVVDQIDRAKYNTSNQLVRYYSARRHEFFCWLDSCDSKHPVLWLVGIRTDSSTPCDSQKILICLFPLKWKKRLRMGGFHKNTLSPKKF